MPGIYCNLGVRLGRAGLEAREEKNPLLRALEPISGLSTKSRLSCCEGGGQAKGEEREGGGGKVGVLFYLLLLTGDQREPNSRSIQPTYRYTSCLV